MRWSAGFNDLYTEISCVFEEIFEAYPQIHQVFQTHPDLFNDENSLLPLYYLWQADILHLEEKNTHAESVVSSLLSYGAEDEDLLLHVYLLLYHLKSYEYLTPQVLAQIVELNDTDSLACFSYLFVHLSRHGVLSERNVAQAVSALVRHLDEMHIFMGRLEDCFGKETPGIAPKWYWHLMFQLSEKSERCFISLLTILDKLKRFHALTEDRMNHYMTMAQASLHEADDVEQSVYPLLVDAMRKLIRFDFLSVESGVKDLLYNHADKVYLMCEEGIAVDDVAAALGLIAEEEREGVLLAIDDDNEGLLGVFAKVVPLALLLCASTLDLIGRIYIEISDHNLAGDDFTELVIKLVERLAERGGLSVDQTLTIFLEELRAFKFVLVADEVRQLMLAHRENTLLLCQGSISIHKFAKLQAFHKKLFDIVDEPTALALATISNYVPDLWHVFILLNAIEQVKGIATQMSMLHFSIKDRDDFFKNMLGALHAELEGKQLVPALFIEFFREQLDCMRAFRYPEVDAVVSKQMSEYSGRLYHLCECGIAFRDFLAFEKEVQLQLLQLEPEVAQLLVYLVVQYQKFDEDLRPHHRMSLLEALLAEDSVVGIKAIVNKMPRSGNGVLIEEKFIPVVVELNIRVKPAEISASRVWRVLREVRKQMGGESTAGMPTMFRERQERPGSTEDMALMSSASGSVELSPNAA